MKKLINIIINFSIILFASFLVLFFFEIFLIWDNYYKPYKNPYHLKTSNFEYSFYVNEKQLLVSNQKRIFILGDSMVAGTACAGQNQNITGHLNNLLNQSKKNNIKFLNFGMETLTVTNYIDILENLNISKNDKVIVFLCENDIQINKEVCLIAKNQKKQLNINYPTSCNEILKGNLLVKNNNSMIKKINKLLFNFKIYFIIKEGLANIPFINSLLYRTEFRKLWLDYKSEENLLLISSIIELKKMVESKGSEFYLGYYPLTNLISIDSPQHKRWLQFINYMKLNHKINVFDPYSFLLKNTNKDSMVWSLSDKHPSCAAHKIIAKYLYNEVLLL